MYKHIGTIKYATTYNNNQIKFKIISIVIPTTPIDNFKIYKLKWWNYRSLGEH